MQPLRETDVHYGGNHHCSACVIDAIWGEKQYQSTEPPKPCLTTLNVGQSTKANGAVEWVVTLGYFLRKTSPRRCLLDGRRTHHDNVRARAFQRNSHHRGPMVGTSLYSKKGKRNLCSSRKIGAD